MDLPEAVLVATVAALREDVASDARRAAHASLSALQADNVGSLIAALSRVIASRDATADDRDVARRWVDQSIRIDAAWERWRSAPIAAHAAVQASLQRSLCHIQDEKDGTLLHAAGNDAFHVVMKAARHVFRTLRASWPLLLPRLMTSAKDAASPAWLRAAAYDLIGAWLDALDGAADVKIALDKRGHMLATIASGLAFDNPAPVQRGAIQAFACFLPFSAYLFRRADRAAERGALFGLVARLLERGRGAGEEERGVTSDALIFLAGCIDYHSDAKGLHSVLQSVAPAALAAGLEGAAAGEPGADTLIEVSRRKRRRRSRGQHAH